MKILPLILLLLSIPHANASQGEMESLFAAHNINGSLIIASLDGKTQYRHGVNDKQGYIPASTFKIPNTLIFLEEGLLTTKDDQIKWDGVTRAYAPWNQDQTLKTAFQVSCVWCYQRYAKQVGDKTYLQYLKAFQYGNQLTGTTVDTFWLEGGIRITVDEQIEFLRKVYLETLPIKPHHMTTLKDIMLSEQTDQYRIYSKTGWQGKDGWYVGYLVTGDEVWLFANHIEIKQTTDLPLRKQLTLDAFKFLNIVKAGR